MMNEQEAWLYLAELWESPRWCGDMGGWYVTVKERVPAFGICVAIYHMRRAGDISGRIVNRMWRRLCRYRPSLDSISGYWWRWDRESAEIRTQVCLMCYGMAAAEVTP